MLRYGGPKAANRRKETVPLWITSSAAAAVLLPMGIGLLIHDGSVGPQKRLAAAAEPKVLLPVSGNTLQEEIVLLVTQPGSSDAVPATDLLRLSSDSPPPLLRPCNGKIAMTAEVAPDSFQEAPTADTHSYSSYKEELN